MSTPSEKKLAWVAAQIDASFPPSAPQRGFGQTISSLAEAVKTLEAGSGQVFGLGAFEAEPAAFQALAAKAWGALEAWRAKLKETHGDEGEDTVVTIAARSGVVFPGTKSASVAQAAAAADPRGDAALAALAAALADGDAIAEAFRASDGLGEDFVARVEIGAPDPERLERFAAHFEALYKRQLPSFYVRLLASYNGIAVAQRQIDGDGDDGDTTAAHVPARDLSEPSLWPIDVYGDHLGCSDVDLDGIELAFVFGEIADSGSLVFDAGSDEGAPEDAPVFWLPRRFSSEPPTRIAASIADFITLWSACHLDVGEVLGRARVPGWGG
jgi:hypothetical protein